MPPQHRVDPLQVRLQIEGFVERLDSLIQPSLPVVNQTQVHVSLGHVWGQLNNGLKMFSGFPQPLLLSGLQTGLDVLQQFRTGVAQLSTQERSRNEREQKPASAENPWTRHSLTTVFGSLTGIPVFCGKLSAKSISSSIAKILIYIKIIHSGRELK